MSFPSHEHGMEWNMHTLNILPFVFVSHEHQLKSVEGKRPSPPIPLPPPLSQVNGKCPGAVNASFRPAPGDWSSCLRPPAAPLPPAAGFTAPQQRKGDRVAPSSLHSPVCTVLCCAGSRWDPAGWSPEHLFAIGSSGLTTGSFTEAFPATSRPSQSLRANSGRA